MTWSGERSALDPDPVPVHHRLRDLLARHPVGPLPAAKLKEIHHSLHVPRTRPLVPSKDFQSRKQARRAAAAALAAVVNAAGPSTPDSLDGLGARLRSLVPEGRPPHLEPSDLHLSGERVSAIAAHLLRTGTSAVELLTGLALAAHPNAEVDPETIRVTALLGCSYGFEACAALRRSPTSVHDLHWLITRTPAPQLDMFLSELGRLPRQQIDGLLETLTVAEALAITLMSADLRPVPDWLKGHERLAKLLAAVADDPAQLDPGFDALVDLVRLWDEVRFGGLALLGFAPGERERIAASLRAALADSASVALAEHALAERPDGTDCIWLRRRIEDARTDLRSLRPGLAFRVAVPPPSTHRDAQMHVLVDGDPVTVSWFERGHGHSPEAVLDLGPDLRGGAEAVDVRLSEADCVEECCGAFRVRISRDTENVEWELRDTGRAGKPERQLRFPADAYDAEVDRAHADRSWEWPARRAARLLRARLNAERDLLGRWDCRTGWIQSMNRDRSTLTFTFIYPEARATSSDQPWLQFKQEVAIPDAVTVDDHAVAAAVDRIVAALRTTDPKTIASVCGGSRKHANALGFPWPD
ncbi:hypothetical protein GCM10009783_17720 [Glycomyces lechevalierae]